MLSEAKAKEIRVGSWATYPLQQWHTFKLNGAFKNYRQTSNMCRTLVGNKIVHHSDIVGASPVGATPATSSF